MTNGLTTSKNIPTGKQIDKPKIRQLNREELAKQKQQDLRVLESYQVQIDQLNLEIPKLEKALELKLPEREVKDQIRILKEQLEKFEKYKTILKKRIK